MAWIDDRIWCHPKMVGLSPAAGWTYVKGLAYSSGMNTAGHLDISTQKLLGAGRKVRLELVAAGLWDMNGDGESVVIHDWNEYNSKRDERRRKDRERKREMRRKKG